MYGELKVTVVLKEDRNCLTKVFEPQCANVIPVYEDIAFVGVVKPHCEFQDRAFPGTIHADNDLQL